MARAYYERENVTITRRQNLIYDENGAKYEDIWTANNKLKSGFFQMAIDQRASFLGANGVTFGNPETKAKLSGANFLFDTQVFNAMTESYIGGTAYAFFNHNHIEIFPLERYCALLDELDGRMKAGIYYWRLEEGKPLVAFLYLPDGYVVYQEDESGKLTISQPFRAYRLVSVKSAVSEEIMVGEPYPGFPITPLPCNRRGVSLLVGNRDTIDALDMARSSSVNNVDSDMVYWFFEGLQGMNDFDIVKALFDLRRCHGLATPPADSGARVTPHTVQAPFEGAKITIDELKEQLNFDLGIFNPQSVIASSDTATAIRAAYEMLNVQTNVFELRYLQPFISRILLLAGIEDTFTFKRDAITNVQETMQTILMLAPYVDAQYIREAGMTLLGDADKVEEVSRRMDADAARQVLDK